MKLSKSINGGLIIELTKEELAQYASTQGQLELDDTAVEPIPSSKVFHNLRDSTRKFIRVLIETHGESEINPKWPHLRELQGSCFVFRLPQLVDTLVERGAVVAKFDQSDRKRRRLISFRFNPISLD